MLELSNKTKAIKELMESLSSQLDELNSDNFDEKYQSSLETMMVVQKLKDDLIEKIGIDNLVKFDPELFIRAKQIEKKYDNIIEKFRLEVNKLEKEISSIYCRKKIVNYIR